MDDNQYSDAAYEERSSTDLRKIARDIAIVGGFFLFYCAGFLSALLVK